MEDFEAFARLLAALRPWLGQLVVVGGWAHRLHRFHGLAQPPTHLPLRTRDADLAFSPGGALAGDLRKALTDAGFAEEYFGEDSPPATHYRLGDEDEGFYVEFLTPLVGSDIKRGKRDATASEGGITAQKLRYLDVLLIEPWSVRVGPERQIPIEAEVTDTIRDAARIPQDRRLAPQNVQRACRYGLLEILGIPEPRSSEGVSD